MSLAKEMTLERAIKGRGHEMLKIRTREMNERPTQRNLWEALVDIREAQIWDGVNCNISKHHTLFSLGLSPYLKSRQ